MTRLIHSEFIKLRSTKTWWLFALGTFVMTSLALLVNFIQAHFALLPFDEYVKAATNNGNPSPEQQAQLREQWAAQHDVIGQAVNIYTSGQFFGVLFVSVFAILMITNEYYHQTATATFLTTPHRSRVVGAKLITGILMAGFFWLFISAVDAIAGSIFLNTQGFGSQLGEWPVQRAFLLNLAAFACWSVLGIGLGALIRSQIGATITATVAYLIGTIAAAIIFELVHTFLIKKDWVLTAEVIVPSRAQEIMTSAIKSYPQSPPQWVGAAVLIGYGVIAGLIGTMILRKRDVT
jgi:ABC-2 type transport system permease protein